MALNIYQKVKIAIIENGKCKTLHNKLAKLSVETTDNDLIYFLKESMRILSYNRIIMSEIENWKKIRKDTLDYVEMKINEVNIPKKDLKNELKKLIEEYQSYKDNCMPSYTRDEKEIIEGEIKKDIYDTIIYDLNWILKNS